MNGYAKDARNEIFALRPAPIQVNRVFLFISIYLYISNVFDNNIQLNFRLRGSAIRARVVLPIWII